LSLTALSGAVGGLIVKNYEGNNKMSGAVASVISVLKSFIGFTRNFETVTDAKADKWLRVGQKISIDERGGAVFQVKLKADNPADEYGAIASTVLTLFALVIEKTDSSTIVCYGAKNDGLVNDFGAMKAMHDDTGRIKLAYRGNHLLQGTLSFSAGTQRKEINFNKAKVKIGTINGDYLFIINGSASVQSYLNFISNGQVDLAGAKGLIDWNNGSHTSGLRDIYIYDSTNRADSNAVRSFNSFNMIFDNFRTSGSLGGTHLWYIEDKNITGFHNLTNVKLKDSILQTNQNNAVLVKIDLPDTAADTITLENTALKANGNNSFSLDIDGYINCLKLDALHCESSFTAFRTAAGKTINAEISNCIFSDVENCFDWGASGWINWSNNRAVAGANVRTGKKVFTLMNAEVSLQGTYIVDGSKYDNTIAAGTGRFRRDKSELTRKTNAATNITKMDDCREFFSTVPSPTYNLPDLADVGAGFCCGIMTRSGTTTINSDVADRILGVSGSTIGGGINTGGSGNYIKLMSQNDGNNLYWQVVSIVSTWSGF